MMFLFKGTQSFLNFSLVHLEKFVTVAVENPILLKLSYV